jgi:hypothetical protein
LRVKIERRSEDWVYENTVAFPAAKRVSVAVTFRSSNHRLRTSSVYPHVGAGRLPWSRLLSNPSWSSFHLFQQYITSAVETESLNSLWTNQLCSSSPIWFREVLPPLTPGTKLFHLELMSPRSFIKLISSWVKRPELEADYKYRSMAKVKKSWSFTSTSCAYILMHKNSVTSRVSCFVVSRRCINLFKWNVMALGQEEALVCCDASLIVHRKGLTEALPRFELHTC